MGRYNNVGGFHLLTDEQREEQRWFKCQLFNESYNPLTQIRSAKPECVWDEEQHCVIATYTIQDKDIKTVIEEVCDKVDELLQKKLYTDVEVQFPDGPKVIQFRNELDRANLSNVTQAAISLVIAGTPEYIMPYRTADNVTQFVPASGLIAIGNSVMAAKQLLVSTAWNHKDTLRAMESLDDIASYDIQAGW